MNRFDLHPPLGYQTDAQSIVSTFPPAAVNRTLGAASRLIVLVPTGIDDSTTTRRIWELANASGAHVRLLSLYKDPAEKPGLHRRLVRMASLLEDGNVPAELKLEWGTNWVELVKQDSQADDTIVCFTEQRAGLLHRPLSQILRSNLNNSVYILSSWAPQNLPQANWLSQIIAWSGAIGLIIGFFLLQIRIVAMPQLLILSVIVEAWLIGIWNSLFG